MFRIIRNSEDVFCMSSKKSDLASNLEETTTMIISHLIKLYLYPTSKDVSHWRQEVYNFLHNVPKLKSTKKLPSKRFILNNTINMNKEMIDILYNVVDEDYSKNNQKISLVDMKKLTVMILNYYDWLASELSDHMVVSRNAVYTKLKDLGF